MKTDERLYGKDKEVVLGSDYDCYRRIKRKLLAELRERREYLVNNTNIYTGDGMQLLKDVEDAIKHWKEV
jgi:hypothetical protein